ncbi:hypothetical protein HU200_003374 [Digitaria exilis]|uniref:Thaumatin-like protein n=1 Tax=Digitaria exilis TaxID=1010633 RepID=A0A835KUF8_9POAL|nr:hypothetical protein HU200_003374 [Digitaria exilis]
MAKSVLLGILLVAGAILTAESSRDANLTIVNDCNYPIWPMVIPNDGFSPISGNTFRLDSRGAIASFTIPPSAAWSGKVMARVGCAAAAVDSSPSRCVSGEELPATVVQLQVHAYGRADMAVYGVSLSGGFNVAATVTPHAFQSGDACPALGCTVDLNLGCPAGRRVTAADLAGGDVVVACRSDPEAGGYFKQRCPQTLTWSGDAVDVEERCVAPGELKVIFCPKTMLTAEADETELISRAVVKDRTHLLFDLVHEHLDPVDHKDSRRPKHAPHHANVIRSRSWRLASHSPIARSGIMTPQWLRHPSRLSTSAPSAVESRRYLPASLPLCPSPMRCRLPLGGQALDACVLHEWAVAAVEIQSSHWWFGIAPDASDLPDGDAPALRAPVPASPVLQEPLVVLKLLCDLLQIHV